MGDMQAACLSNSQTSNNIPVPSITATPIYVCGLLLLDGSVAALLYFIVHEQTHLSLSVIPELVRYLSLLVPRESPRVRFLFSN